MEDLWAFNEEILVRAIADSELPVISAVGHEIDTTLSDLAADLRAPTPSAAAELAVWNKSDFLVKISDQIREMEYNLKSTIRNDRNRLNQIIQRPAYIRPESMIRQREQNLDNLLRHFENGRKNVLDFYKNRLSLNLSRLESLSPLAILSRGYAVLKNAFCGETVKSVAELKSNDQLEAILKDGSALVHVDEIKQK